MPPSSDRLAGIGLPWRKYAGQFRRAASKRDWEQERIEEFLKYARRLHSQGLPVLFDGVHLAMTLTMEPDFVFAISNKPNKFYREFEIAKRSGARRPIAEPLPNLKWIQRWLKHHLFDVIPISAFAKSYAAGTSIRAHARLHRRQPVVVSLDIREFFPSIGTGRVVGLLRRAGYSSGVATLVGKLCTLNDALPQGAPTSPTISNIVCRRLDARLGAWARARELRYSRYADDITLSGDYNAAEIVKFVEYAVSDSGFVINDDKTRVRRRHQRQLVTGVVVNDRMQAPREYRRLVRQQVHYIRRFGLASHVEHARVEQMNHLAHVMGKLDHMLFLNPDDDWAIDAKRDLAKVALGQAPEDSRARE